MGEPMSRKMQVTAEPLAKDHILIPFRQLLASAEIEEASIQWYTIASSLRISCEIKFADGTHATETIDLDPMLQAWATGMVAEHEGVKA